MTFLSVLQIKKKIGQEWETTESMVRKLDPGGCGPESQASGPKPGVPPVKIKTGRFWFMIFFSNCYKSNNLRLMFFEDST